MAKNIFNGINSLSTVLLIKEALKRKIKVSHINNYQKEMTFLELFYKGHFEYIVAQSSSMTSYAAYYAEKNKMLTKSLLSKAKINVAKGELFYKNKISEAHKFIKEIGCPVVIKPFDGDHGNLVFIGLKNEKGCDEAIKKIIKKSKYVLVEKEFKGKEFRFITTVSKVLAVTYRDPANVVGNGIHTIKELIKVKNNSPMRGNGNEKPLVKIKIDNTTKQNLIEQNIKLNYIPIKGEKIYLRKESNISTGGDSIDVTDIVHPELKKIAVRSVKAIPGLAYAGVDLMSNKDISKKPTKSSYIIVELNSSPGIYPQHFPYQGKSRNVAKEIIDILFPETKGKYIK